MQNCEKGNFRFVSSVLPSESNKAAQTGRISMKFDICAFFENLSQNQDGLKLNGTHQILVYADDVNILGGSIHTVKENAEALVVATKQTGLEVNADKTKYMVMSRE